VDIHFVSHLGKHATSTVGLSESVITIKYSLAIGFTMAATAMEARRAGKKDYKGANKARVVYPSYTKGMYLGVHEVL
jgi:Na+-driven multidrug efflux pump